MAVLIERTADVRAAAMIVLADDHRLVRRAVRNLLGAAVGLQVVAETGDLGETVRQVRAYKPNVLVLDLGMPGGSSLAAIPAILPYLARHGGRRADNAQRRSVRAR